MFTLVAQWPFVLTQKRWLMTIAPYLFLTLFALPLLAINLPTYPPIWFDEGYKTHAARLLAERGFYGSCTVSGCLPFDPGISSGPADIGTVALSFILFGIGIWQARLPSILFTLVAIGSGYALTKRIFGAPTAFISMLLLMAFPPMNGISFLLIGRQALGEMPAMALILLGLWAWVMSLNRTTARWQWMLFSGIAMGVGLLSKTQIAIALVPALLLIGLGRLLLRQDRIISAFTPSALTVAIVAGWSLLGRLLTPEPARSDNAAMLAEALRTNLITDLFGRNLNRTAWLMLLIMGLGITSSLWHMRDHLRNRTITNRDWAELTLVLFTFSTMIWFAFLSIGWPRYAFAGLTIGLILNGALITSVVSHLMTVLRKRFPRASQYLPLLIILILMGAALLINGIHIAIYSHDHLAIDVGQYINQTIPRDAIIESWEWELDALTEHRRFHHPHQRYLFLAIRQFSHGHKAFDLGYDTLEADPDYLISGPYSEWIHIYNPLTIQRSFQPIAHIGAYTIYQRVR